MEAFGRLVAATQISDFWQAVLIALLATVVTIVVRNRTRPDRKGGLDFKKEDFLVGIGLAVTGLVTFFGYLFQAAQKLGVLSSKLGTKLPAESLQSLTLQFEHMAFVCIGAVCAIFACLGMLIVVSGGMNKAGWITVGTEPPIPKFWWLIGVDGMGLTFLIAALLVKGELQ